MGHPVLRQAARPLRPDEIASESLRVLVTDMVDTLRDYGGIGLAAPQIAESIRIAIIEIPDGTSRYGEMVALQQTVLINPDIHILDSEPRGYWEGCLSIPGLRGYVERPQHIKVDYTDLQAERQEIELNGFLATVFQHELDHLDGKLYIDRMSDPTLLSFEQEYVRYLAPREELEVKE